MVVFRLRGEEEELIDALHELGRPVSASELAAHVVKHPGRVRQLLADLARAGLLERERRRRDGSPGTAPWSYRPRVERCFECDGSGWVGSDGEAVP